MITLAKNLKSKLHELSMESLTLRKNNFEN